VAIDGCFMLMNDDFIMAVLLSSLVLAGICFVCARLNFSRGEGVVGNLLWISSSLFLIIA
jgi:hypothetical protein